jgi:hypothetical protein
VKPKRKERKKKKNRLRDWPRKNVRRKSKRD